MSVPLGGSEPPAPRQVPGPGMGRKIGLWVLGAAGVLLVMWGISQYIEYLGTSPAPAGRKVEHLASPSVSESIPPPSPGKLNLRLNVHARDEKGKDFPVGTALPRRLTITLLDSSGQEYTAPFDRIGAWVVEVSPGKFRIPGDQQGLGNWSWKLEGAGLKLDTVSGDYRAVWKLDSGTPTIELTLY